ncbi:hypothetical protein STANM309S_04497 [Streptomyces tanashiensis]
MPGEKYGKVDDTTVPSANFCRVIQSALYCKGYDGGDIDGTYNSRVKTAVAKLKVCTWGVDGTYPGTSLRPKVIKGLFNMDAYVTVNYGSDTIRAIQRWLNRRYILRKDFYVIPCDGHHSRDVAKSMLLAVQYELGMADGVANGAFGPGTQASLKTHTLSVGSSGVWVQLFTAAMVLNGRWRPSPMCSTPVSRRRSARSRTSPRSPRPVRETSRPGPRCSSRTATRPGRARPATASRRSRPPAPRR